MQFFTVNQKYIKSQNKIEIRPEFHTGKLSDLMVKGGKFAAVFDSETGFWSRDINDIPEIVDRKIKQEYIKIREENPDKSVVAYYLCNESSKNYARFVANVNKMGDSNKTLDDKILFANDIIKPEDYATKTLSYALSNGSCDSYNKLMSVLYEPNERTKIEWAIGSVFTGDSKKIQKFIALYGPSGSGKSTVLNIIERLFEEYAVAFNAKALGQSSETFSTAPFASNPLVAIDHDTDLSRMDENTRFNLIVSHESILINDKHKSIFPMRVHAFLFLASNNPVKLDITSGIVRRLIDVHPSGNLIDVQEYYNLMDAVNFELGAIANHCIQVYKRLGINYYNAYIPTDMLLRTDYFYNFVDDNITELSVGPIGLKRAFALYLQYCEETKQKVILGRSKFRDALKEYYDKYVSTYWDGQKEHFNAFIGFKHEKFVNKTFYDIEKKMELENTISLLDQSSLLDDFCKDNLAQYATEAGIPERKWDKVITKLKDLDTSKMHYVMLEQNHIVIDFDLKDDTGEKSLQKNLDAIAKWPETYAELSKSGQGIHLHYIYDGDPLELSKDYSEGIEVKVFVGNSALRRKLTKCNNKSISHISSGLPIKEKEGTKMVDIKVIKSEKALRDLINRNLRKEIHSSTKSSVDFIERILSEAYASGMQYDVSDMRPRIFSFASKSTHQSDVCIKTVGKMQFKSESDKRGAENQYDTDELVMFDCEVFPNLLVVCWKVMGDDKEVVKMINPTSSEIEDLFKMKLVGFNNLSYDNHILYSRYLGYTNEQIYKLSQKLIMTEGAKFREAYDISYTDVYDFLSDKQSLKKFEIELGIHHQELGLPWDEPVPEELWGKVADYCANDVIATEAVFNNRIGDFRARQILAALSGLSVNKRSNNHTTHIIFGNERDPDLVYVDLAETFPGYECIIGSETDNKVHNMYRGTDLGIGGFNVVIPGMYENVAVFDVSSLHPHSIIAMNAFGSYTGKFKNIVDARVAIKHGDLEEAKRLLGEKAAPYLQDPSQVKSLAKALKIAVNSVYGLTASKKYNTPFRDNRNVNNIVALRGALFMRELLYQLENQNYTIIHIRTDSLKIPNVSEEIMDFIMTFAKDYGYTFEFEDIYEKMCLVDTSNLIAKVKGKDGRPSYWKGVGAKFKQPFVFKTLFSKEEITFNDLGEIRSVKSPTAIYIDFNENLPDNEHNRVFIGRIGCFCPVKEGCGGGLLVCKRGENKYDAVGGTKGWRWKEKEVIEQEGLQDEIDMDYYHKLVDDIKKEMSQFGDVEEFLS